MWKVMNFCRSPALSSLSSQAPAGEGSRSRPAGRGVCSPGCRHSLPLWLLAGWVHGFFPAFFVSCGAAFSGGYTLLSQEADWNSKALPVLWHFPALQVTGMAQPGVGEGAFSSQTNLGTRVIAGLGSIASKPLWAATSPPCAELAAAPAPSSIRFLLPVLCRALRAPLAPHHIQTHPIGRGWCSSCSLARAEGWLGQQQAGQRSDTLCLVSGGHQNATASGAKLFLLRLGCQIQGCGPHSPFLSVCWC